jgi:hypothetical protein
LRGNWALKYLPERYKEIIENSLCIYTGQADNVTWDHKLLFDFAEYMLQEICFLVLQEWRGSVKPDSL